jgi:hypothetical protein
MRRVETAEIVAAAREWLRTPWRHQGRLKGMAVVGRVDSRRRQGVGLLDFGTRAYGRIPDG